MAPKWIQLALAPVRSGRMGTLDLGRDYIAGVKARAAMLARATAVVRLDSTKRRTEHT
jgi:hypothetical protein